MPYDDHLLPDDAPEVPQTFTVSPPPEDAPKPPMPPMPPMPPKPGFRPPEREGVCRISGRVVDRWGLPKGGARVSLFRARDHREPLLRTETDARGRFRFVRLSPGRYRIEAQKHHRRGEKSVSLSPKDCRADITVRLR